MNIDKIDLTNATVLIVDDVPANLNVLYNALESEKYKILAAPNGEVALKNAQRTIPDLILLDIMMPGIDGFEACRRLKADKSTADIPIIFITARSETESIVEGFQIGGVDYIIKPFQHEEVRARVRTHLTIKRLQDGLREVNDRLREANKKIEAQKKVAEQELQDARQVQMSLMPKSAPPFPGVEIAGKCMPANTVSGDFFDYLVWERPPGSDNRGQETTPTVQEYSPNEIGLVIADVTGKAMKGAMNAVMTDGILRMAVEEMESLSPARLMMKVNNVLKVRMERNMNVTMVIGVIHRNRVFAKNSVSEGEITLTLANAGHHALPILFRDGEIQTLKIGGLPLGMKAGIEYDEEQFQLQGGDVLIFMTDGIIEAEDSDEQLYEYSGRLEKTISQFTFNLSAELMVDAIINDAIDFGGEKATRDDDMTVVVAKIQ